MTDIPIYFLFPHTSVPSWTLCWMSTCGSQRQLLTLQLGHETRRSSQQTAGCPLGVSKQQPSTGGPSTGGPETRERLEPFFTEPLSRSTLLQFPSFNLSLFRTSVLVLILLGPWQKPSLRITQSRTFVTHMAL